MHEKVNGRPIVPLLSVVLAVLTLTLTSGCDQQGKVTSRGLLPDVSPEATPPQQLDARPIPKKSQPSERYLRALRLMKQDRFASALKLLQLELETDANNNDALRNRGVCYARLSKFDLALQDLDRVIARSPNDPAAHYNRGFVLLETKKYSDAILAYTVALQYRPDLARGYVSRGLAYTKLGKDRLAIRDYSRGLIEAPEMGEAFLLRAEAYMRCRDVVKAEKDLEAARALGHDV